MSDRQRKLDEVGRLTSLMLEGVITPDDRRRLEDMLLADVEALDYYQSYIEIHSLLHWSYCTPERSGQNDQQNDQQDGQTDQGVAPQCDLHGDDWRLDDWDAAVPPRAARRAPAPIRAFGIGRFSQVEPFSYLTSLLIVCFAAIIAWDWKIADCRGFSDAAASPHSVYKIRPLFVGGFDAQPVFVGRITAAVDCRWAEGEAEVSRLDYVPAGRRFKLASGLLEITYGSGAKVLLEGPAVYEVCASGGLLTSGKLTGRLASGAEAAHAVEDVADDAALAGRFAIRTPTAMIVDLGTEFGVEVDENGDTMSHVFHGSVRLCPLSILHDEAGLVLNENESAQVERVGHDRFTTARSEKSKSEQFIREIDRRTHASVTEHRPAG